MQIRAHKFISIFFKIKAISISLIKTKKKKNIHLTLFYSLKIQFYQQNQKEVNTKPTFYCSLIFGRIIMNFSTYLLLDWVSSRKKSNTIVTFLRFSLVFVSRSPFIDQLHSIDDV